MIEDFAHRLTLDRIRDGERIDLVADDEERGRDRRAARPAVARPAGGACEPHRDGEMVRAEGRVAASLEQRCVITGEPVAAHVDEAFEIAFVPEPQ